jgi:CRISPR-associated protein Cmr1
MNEMEIQLKTLTPLWTGGVDQTSDRLHETGLLGSLRWWYEALVRGLGGYACDPTSEDRCPDKKGQHCVVCELFGCTGWGRKFRLQVTDQPRISSVSTGNPNLRAIEKGQSIRIKFIPLRKIEDEEWALLSLTLRLIAEYGAIGGKTVFKPSDEPGREAEFHHLDFGLVSITLPDGWPGASKSLDELKAFVTDKKWRSGSYKYWASLQNFWCVKGRYLARQDSKESTFNQVITREEPKAQAKYRAKNEWLAGEQQKSKKVFSFRHPTENRRTFGFVNPGLVDFEEIKRRLKQAWPDFEPNKEFLTGEQILRKLISQ